MPANASRATAILIQLVRDGQVSAISKPWSLLRLLSTTGVSRGLYQGTFSHPPNISTTCLTASTRCSCVVCARHSSDSSYSTSAHSYSCFALQRQPFRSAVSHRLVGHSEGDVSVVKKDAELPHRTSVQVGGESGQHWQRWYVGLWDAHLKKPFCGCGVSVGFEGRHR